MIFKQLDQEKQLNVEMIFVSRVLILFGIIAGQDPDDRGCDANCTLSDSTFIRCGKVVSTHPEYGDKCVYLTSARLVSAHANIRKLYLIQRQATDNQRYLCKTIMDKRTDRRRNQDWVLGYH